MSDFSSGFSGLIENGSSNRSSIRGDFTIARSKNFSAIYSSAKFKIA